MPAEAPFADVEIRILARGPDGYPAEVNADEDQGKVHFSLGILDPDDLPGIPTRGHANDRKRLANWLFTHPKSRMNWDRFRGRYPRRRIRIRIDESASELHALPWELLSDEMLPSAKSLAVQNVTPFSRYQAHGRMVGRPIMRPPLRILVAVANPVDLLDYGLSRIEVENEWAALANIVNNPDVEVTLFPGGEIVSHADDLPKISETLGRSCRLEELARKLRRGYHVLHFIGHGICAARSQEMSLFMTDADNRAKLVRADEFAQVFHEWDIHGHGQSESALRLVFLATCQSATTDTVSAMRSLALQLVKTNIPAVLAMQDVLPVRTGRGFSEAFYDRVLEHGLIDLACNDARAAIDIAGLPGTSRLPPEAIPVLYMRMRDGRLWDFHGFGTAGEQETPWNRLIVAMRVGKCTPIIGPDLGRTLLGTRRVIAETWAKTRDFPMAEHLRRDLPQVGQYLSVRDGFSSVRDHLVVHLQERLRALYPDELADMPASATPNELILEVSQAHRNHGPVAAYDILADLPFPIYVTANPSELLADRLRMVNKQPYIGVYHWQLQPSDWLAASHDIASHEPTVECPLVYHMFGKMDEPDSFVLTEDDYFDYLISVGRTRERAQQEKNPDGAVNAALASNMLLFLGFRLEEWAFRVLLRSIMAGEGGYLRGRYQHVAVQINPETCDISDINQAREYLARFFGKHQITLYWGKAEDFLEELQEIWKTQPPGR